MAVTEMALLGPRDAVHPDDVVGLERWVSAQQAQLRLLHRQLAAALDAGRAAAERAAAPGDDERRRELERQVRALVVAQAERLAAQVEHARAEAAARRAQAVHEATMLLIAAGADASVIRRIVGAGAPIDAVREPGPAVAAAVPPVVREEVVDLTATEPAADEHDGEDREGHWSDEDWSDGPSENDSMARPVDHALSPEGRDDGPAATLFGASPQLPVLVGVPLGGDQDARVFDQFWGGVPGEVPGRGRLRRWVQWVEQR